MTLPDHRAERPQIHSPERTTSTRGRAGWTVAGHL